MPISASVNIAFTAGNNKYKADFTLPSTEPSDTAPIVFNIESCPANAEGEDYQSTSSNSRAMSLLRMLCPHLSPMTLP